MSLLLGLRPQAAEGALSIKPNFANRVKTFLGVYLI